MYLNDVEAMAAAHPSISECACVGVADDATSEAVKLFIVRAHGSTLTEHELIDLCCHDLAATRCPRSSSSWTRSRSQQLAKSGVATCAPRLEPMARP